MTIKQGTRPAILTAQRIGIIQLSSDETEASQIAKIDVLIASKEMALANKKINDIRQGQYPMEEDIESPFAGLTQTTGHTVTTRRTVYFAVNRGQGWERYRVPVQELDTLIGTCRENHWEFEVGTLPKGYEGGRQGKIIQRVAIAAGYNGGNMNEYAVATVAGIAAPTALGNLTFNGVTASNTSTGASGTSLNRQPNGTGVGATRPNQWTRFVSMVGGINPFKQGHLINQRLGGDGTHDNLVPFTPSLNAMHFQRVEKYVINQTEDGTATSRDEYADYSVTPTYGVNPGIVPWAQGQFATMIPDDQRDAMTTAGIITPAAAAAYAPGAALNAADIALANAWLTNYINSAFPTNIVCWAEFIDDVGGGTYNSTPRQTVTITNDF